MAQASLTAIEGEGSRGLRHARKAGKNPLQFAVLLATAAWTVTSLADPQSTDASVGDQTPQRLGEIEVTGSHIRHVDLETQHPILVLERADILRTGLTSVSDVVQLIAQNGETMDRGINNGAHGGAQEANLRSLGSNRTLVLVNGVRWVTELSGSVDLSGIPLALVDRVEVLLDSTSAIYGSDAIAGVINIITRRDYQGGELGLYYGLTDHDDGERRAYDLTFGHKGDNWSAAGGVEYSNDDPVFAGNRAISAVPIFGLPPAATGSIITPYSWLIPDSYVVDGSFSLFRLIDGRPGTSPSDFRLADPNADTYNYQPLNYLQTPQERRALFAQGRYEFTPTFAMSMDVLFNQRLSAQQLAPSDIMIDTTNVGSPDAIPIAADNLFNPFGEPIDIALRRLVEAGPRVFQQTNDTNRLHIAFDGSFAMLDRDFSWNVDAAAARSNQRELTGPYADDSRLRLALGPSFLDAAGVAECGTPATPIPGCVPLDFFGPPGSITPAMLNYIDAFEVNRTHNDSDVVDMHLASSELFALPGGGLGVAAGVDHRRDSGADIRDPLETSGDANGNGGTTASTRGAYSVSEAYLEFDAPLLAEKALAQELGVTLGTRYSYYSNFGGTTNSQLGLRWKPVDDLLVRANYAQGFRAPSVDELFQGAITAQDSSILDPCDARNAPSAAVTARCRALGVPPDVNSDRQAANVTFSGNPELKPETSTSRGVGFVYSPASLQGFDMSVDWYDIRLREPIGLPSDQLIVDNCYTRNDDAACALITRAGNGTISHVAVPQQNLVNGIETTGYDLALLYRHDTPIGRITARWNTNYVDYFGEIGRPAQGAVLGDGTIAEGNVVGLNSPNLSVSSYFGVIWRVRSQLQLIWERDGWNASITGRYFSPIKEDCSVVFYVAASVGDPSLTKLCNTGRLIMIGANEVPENRVASATFVDVEGSWDAAWHGRIAIGVRNAFDRTPPVSYSAFENSFFPDYDLPGRFFYASYRQRF